MYNSVTTVLSTRIRLHTPLPVCMLMHSNKPMSEKKDQDLQATGPKLGPTGNIGVVPLDRHV
jgi:hypothetical protein